MKNNLTKNLRKILDDLFAPYIERVPDVLKITEALIEEKIITKQEDIENDHVAFRTMGVKHLGMASLEKIFSHYGYTARDEYYFEHKKVKARWYAPPSNEFPRIFISELSVADFSKEIQDIIASYTNEVLEDPIDKLNLDDVSEVTNFLNSPLWRTPTSTDYKKLLETSEYAAWVIYNRYYLNHYTISIHSLPKGYNTLEEFNSFLASIGITLSNAGGIIKESKDGLLLQSSTVSQLNKTKFSDGITLEIAGSYVEFAERKVLPEFKQLPNNELKRSHRREGFETGNADKIFESTFQEQTKRKDILN